MKVFYDERFNIDLGPLNRLHPFDGLKFRRVREGIKDRNGVSIEVVEAPVSQATIDGFVSPLLRRLLAEKRYVLQALEVPYLPLIPFSLINSRVLEPMRWAAGATVQAAWTCLDGQLCWNLAGGYHHASRTQAEGFCIYNDVGIAVQNLRQTGALAGADEVLIVDVDAHHGNGNARVFMEDRQITLLDIYDDDIYPNSPLTKQRVDINLPVRRGCTGSDYLHTLSKGLSRIAPRYRMAFVVAGTDVLATDPLGGLKLSIDDCVARDKLVLDHLDRLGIPAVVLGGGGYGRESAAAIMKSIASNA